MIADKKDTKRVRQESVINKTCLKKNKVIDRFTSRSNWVTRF